MTTIKEALQQGRETLAPTSATATLDVQVLMADLLGRPRSWILAHTEERLQKEQIARFEERLQRCASGHPLPYVVGWWEFFGRRFDVSPAVLIPRPETELLVEQALEFIKRHAGKVRVVDVGTGSGCIAVTLALEADNVFVVAIDRSLAALEVAGRNCVRHEVEQRVELIQGDLLSCLDHPFDLVCANLPYIPSQDLTQLAVARVEPRLALDGGQTGLDPILGLLLQLERRLAPQGLALLEIGADQGEEIVSLLPESSSLKLEILPDFAGKDRILRVRKGT
ncbi:MAG: peptide chain release factor N(5)-glutamine methyltransferase [Anaerolineales bacterium]